MRPIAVVAVTLAAFALDPVLPLHAAAAPATHLTEPAAAVSHAKTTLARSLALSLQDSSWARSVRSALGSGSVDPLALARGSGTRGAAIFRTAAEPANAAILAAKGLPASTGSVLALRLAGTAIGTVRLVAADADDDHADSIPAFDPTGGLHQLDAGAAPRQPVAVIGTDEKRTLTAGIAVLRSELAAHHVSAAGPGAATPNARPATAGYWATRVMHVRLNDDEEPWFKGDAEIYTIVSGVGLDDQPQVDIVQMPYLDNDHTDYYPGQILVNWSHYKYDAVDAVMMEEDDSTNYRALAQALVSALLTVLSGVQYAPMVDAILQAMPDSWWTDDPDYVDSWYLLTRETNTRRVGARGNGTIDYQPYFVSQL